MRHRATTIDARTQLYADATALVEREHASGLTLELVARRLATSRRQLQRCYAEVGATSFREQLAHVRMDRAAALLSTTAAPVQEIARAVGYSQPAQFAKAFHRRHGQTPTAYRAQALETARRGPRMAA